MDNREQKNSQKQKKTQKHKNNYTLSTITMVVSRFGVRIIVYSLLAILFYYGITKAYDFGYQAFTVKAVDSGEGTEILVNIRKGMTKEEIASLLVSKGLVEDKNTFLVQTALYTSDRYPIQPGSYTLNAGGYDRTAGDRGGDDGAGASQGDRIGERRIRGDSGGGIRGGIYGGHGKWTMNA